MKNTSFILGFLLLATGISAQSITRKVQPGAGGTLSSGGYQLNFTIGEPMIATLVAGGNMITQGFQQTDVVAIGEAGFRSYITGYFGTPTTWEYNNGIGWKIASQPPGSNNNVIIQNSHTITQDINYTVGAGKTFGMEATSSLVVNPNKAFAVTGIANLNGQAIILKSDATGTASIGESNGMINDADNVTVERYLPIANVATGRSWRLLTIPVTSSTKTVRDAWAGHTANGNVPNGEVAGNGTLITGAAYTSGITASTAGYDWWPAINGASSSIRRYTISGSSGAWIATPSTSTLLNATEEGYMLFVRGDRTVTTGSGFTTLRPNGVIKTGMQTYNIPAPATAAYKVIGNPYPATISFETMMTNGSNTSLARNDRFWQWDANIGTNGGYRMISKQGAGNWIRVPAAFSDPAPSHAEYISSSQAFIIETLAAGNNFTIRESDKPAILAGNPPSVFDISNNGRFYSNLNIDNGNNNLTLADGILVSFDAANSNAVDGSDAAKVDNFNENMSILRNSSRLTMENRKTITGNDTIFFQLRNLQVRNYTLQFKTLQLQAGLIAVLQDKYTGKEVPVSTIDNDITTYNFPVTNATASAAADRFRVVFKAGQTLPIALINAKAYNFNGGVQVDWIVANEDGIKIYEIEESIDGRNFIKATSIAATGAGSYNWFDAVIAQGNNYYRIKVIGIDGSISYSSILKLTTNQSSLTDFSIYPNPVKGSHVSLLLSNMEKGKYVLVLYNSSGQKVMIREINHLGGSAAEEITLNSKLASGVYRVSLKGNNNIELNEALLLQR